MSGSLCKPARRRPSEQPVAARRRVASRYMYSPAPGKSLAAASTQSWDIGRHDIMVQQPACGTAIGLGSCLLRRVLHGLAHGTTRRCESTAEVTLRTRSGEVCSLTTHGYGSSRAVHCQVPFRGASRDCRISAVIAYIPQRSPTSADTPTCSRP